MGELSPELSNIPKDHRSLTALEPGVRVSEVVFGRPSYGLEFSSIQAAKSLFPDRTDSDFTLLSKDGKVPTFHAALISKDQAISAENSLSKKPKIGMFFFPGFPGTAAQHIYIAAELYRAAQAKSEIGEIVMAGAIGSSIGPDTAGSPLILSNIKRNANLAAFFVEIIKNQPEDQICDQIYFFGHSMGGVDLPYLTPILNKLLESQGIKTRVGGIVLYEAGGMRGGESTSITSRITRAVSFLHGVKDMESFANEIAYMFPTRIDFERIETQIGLAQDLGDHTLAGNLQSLLAKMGGNTAAGEVPENKYQNLIDEYFIGNEALKSQFNNVSQELETAFFHGDSKKAQKLYKQRIKILKHITDKLWREKEKNKDDATAREMLNMLPKLFTNDGLLGMIPADIRDLLDVPVTVLTSQADIAFPSEKVSSAIQNAQMARLEHIKQEKLRLAQSDGAQPAGAQDGRSQKERSLQASSEAFKESRIFRNAPVTVLAETKTLPHGGVVFNPAEEADFAVQVLTDMLRQAGIQKHPTVIQSHYIDKTA